MPTKPAHLMSFFVPGLDRPDWISHEPPPSLSPPPRPLSVFALDPCLLAWRRQKNSPPPPRQGGRPAGGEPQSRRTFCPQLSRPSQKAPVRGGGGREPIARPQKPLQVRRLPQQRPQPDEELAGLVTWRSAGGDPSGPSFPRRAGGHHRLPDEYLALVIR